MKKRLDGSTHPALDQTVKAPVTIQGVEAKSDKLIIIEKPTPSESEATQALPHNAQNSVSNQEIAVREIPDAVEKLYDPCRDAGARIIKCIEQYQVANKTELVKTEQIHTYDWTSVDDPLTAFARCVAKEESKYADKVTRGFWGHVRRGGRWFSEHAGNAKAFISLVPADSIYTSVLCGGLTFICKMAENIGNVRSTIANFLGKLSVLIETNQQFVNAYQDSAILHKRNAALCLSILDVIEAAIEWFNRNPLKKLLGAAGKPGSYGDTILDKIKDMDDREAEFKDQVNACLNTSIAHIAEDISDMKSFLKDKLDSPERRSTITEHKIVKTKDALQNVYVVFCNEQDAINWYEAVMGISKAKQPKRLKRKQMTRHKAESLMKKYSIDASGSARHDYHSLLQLRYTLPIKDQNRAVAFMQDEQIQHFATSQDPCRLLAHGNGTSDSCTSPISFASAKLATAFQNASAKIILLSFFCGLHTNEAKDPSAHPPGMMLALLLQLIQQLKDHGVRIDSASMQREIEELDVADVGSIGRLLARVEEQVPEDYVLCVIVDAVSCFEDDAHRGEMKDATRVLLELGSREDGPTYKLLMTAPISTVSLWNVFGEYESAGEAEIMEVSNVANHPGGFAALDWETLGGDGTDSGEFSS
ncbi:uncharacterized protein LTHEOB_10427 [Lasiodiplodia theobromae]|uniref:uncharacterized protein n=1 Tax=Lasiodiplodia theobromae TaxID=45133 RepID=UPI0015C3C084|nr:uncharacterized protein LTHEOB_10427 [Lasiodiplodia theobromae]KAF4539263.1 hypothetical protein LTHEOB_10427 [Lasiodiplodia theobromae]